ncbi:MAG: SMC-Scp complex subunit ScpB [Nanoarchaeota archaeon]
MDLSSKELEEIDDELEAESRRKVEAALFLAGKYMSVQELVALTDVNPLLLKKTLADLQDVYKKTGFRLVQQNQMWKMDVASDYSWMVNKLATGSSEFSKAEQETLAIIAYKQPMKQSILVKIRGNKAYDHIKKFVDMGLINKKKMGHTSDLTLTENFHDYFSLSGQEELLEMGKVEEKGSGE